MAKDPFKDLPPIDQDDLEADQVIEQGAPPNEDITTGAAPRNVLKTLSNMAVPLVGGGVLLWWLFMPEPTQDRSQTTAEPVSVSHTQQVSDTSTMISALKADAEKRPVPVAPVMPAAGGARVPSDGQVAPTTGYGAVPPSVTPLPTPMQGAGVDAKAAEDAIKRIEEIRASSLDAGAIKLLDGGSNSANPLSPSSSIQNALAAVEDQKRTALADVDAQTAEMLSRAMASTQPTTAPVSQGTDAGFLAANAAASTAAQNALRLQAPAAQYLVNEGSVVRTVLLTDVSSDLPGRVIARVTSDVYDSTQRYVVIPKGSQLIGAYNSSVAVGQERLLMAMNRLILPNGTWISLAGANASDAMGKSGLAADVNNHFFKMFGSSLILGGASLLLPDEDTRVTTSEGSASGDRSQAGSVFAMSLNEVLRTLLERNKNIAPTLSLRAGQEFIFLVTQDMAMTPYRSK